MKQTINQNQQTRQEPPPPPSIFASNKEMPALLGMLVPYLDLGLLVKMMPRGKNDARVLYAEEGMKRERKGVKMVGVLEVVNDRWGGKGGGWGTFMVGERGVRDV